MRNQYGAGRGWSRGYAVDHVWAMHDVDAFEEQVSAYPAITVLRKGPAGAICGGCYHNGIVWGELSALGACAANGREFDEYK